MNSILKNGKMRVENQTELESEKTRVYAQSSSGVTGLTCEGEYRSM
jgi:hypothetical protein